MTDDDFELNVMDSMDSQHHKQSGQGQPRPTVPDSMCQQSNVVT